MDPRRVGILGGGQLGRMMSEAGHRLGIETAVLDPGELQLMAGMRWGTPLWYTMAALTRSNFAGG